MADDGVRERHGVSCLEFTNGNESAVQLNESADCIVIGKCLEARRVSPAQARYLASKLYRLARRIERRTEA